MMPACPGLALCVLSVSVQKSDEKRGIIGSQEIERRIADDTRSYTDLKTKPRGSSRPI
jgi:hypothetical protein